MLHAASAILPVLVASVLGAIATRPNVATWYAQLAKPAFNPPVWVFSPAWTLLYIFMAYALFRVLQNSRAGRARAAAIVCFLVQIALNAAWSWAFFADQSPVGGLIVIAPLWLAIAATVIVFWPIDRWSGILLLPYLAWVSFAAALNLEIFRLNQY